MAQLTPVDFQNRMNEICKGGDIAMVALAGVNLVDAALGMNAHSFLPAICDYFNHLSYLRSQERKQFSSPTTQSIAEAKRERGNAL